MSRIAPAIGTEVCDGVLTLDKPAAWTSHDVVAKLRALLQRTKIGHAGTLDPAATGVLPILIGQATRIAEYLVGWDKEYLAVLRLGTVTDTQDATGRVIEQKPVPSLSSDQVTAAARQFEGTITQIPPMYSAVKIGGVPLYRSARAGKTVSRQPRTITVHALDVLQVAGPDVRLRIQCSKGTYVRTLCADLGDVLGCGGHLLSLRRTRVGPLSIEHALTIEEVGQQWETGVLGASVRSLDDTLGDVPVVTVDGATAARVVHGMPVPWSEALHEVSPSWPPGLPRLVRIKDEQGRLLALGILPEAGDQDHRKPEQEPFRISIRKVFVGRHQEELDKDMRRVRHGTG